MGRTLLAIALCLGFPSAQQRVIEGRRTAVVQQATGHGDHAPDHDWRRTGGGTTRAIGASVQHNLGAPQVFPLGFLRVAPPGWSQAAVALAQRSRALAGLGHDPAPRAPISPLRV